MREPIKSNIQPMPVPVDAGGVPATKDVHARLESDLEQLATVLGGCDVPALRRVRRTVTRLRQAFAQMDRPATSEQIVVGVNSVLQTMPLGGNIDPEEFANVMMTEMAAEGVSLYELARAARRHRRNSEFVSMPKLFAEVKRARRAAERHRRVLAVDPEERIAQIEHAERRRAGERARTVAEVREALEEMTDSERRIFLESAGQATLPGVGRVTADVLMEALTDVGRDYLFAHAFPLPSERRRISAAAPDGWQPPDSDRVVEILEDE